MIDASLPMLSPATPLPTAVREGGQQRQADYRAALAFERSLLLELTKQLSATSKSENENESAATKTYREQLPTVLADALISGGGIGLAATIDQAAHPQERTR